LPTITAHIIVGDAARAADWYVQALGAEIGARIRVPDGRYMQDDANTAWRRALDTGAELFADRPGVVA
jgi:hypothetical protein